VVRANVDIIVAQITRFGVATNGEALCCKPGYLAFKVWQPLITCLVSSLSRAVKIEPLDVSTVGAEILVPLGMANGMSAFRHDLAASTNHAQETVFLFRFKITATKGCGPRRGKQVAGSQKEKESRAEFHLVEIVVEAAVLLDWKSIL
jgi:hypothetical protein